MLWLHDQLDRNIQRCDNANQAACNHSSPHLVLISRVKYGVLNNEKIQHSQIQIQFFPLINIQSVHVDGHKSSVFNFLNLVPFPHGLLTSSVI